VKVAKEASQHQKVRLGTIQKVPFSRLNLALYHYRHIANYSKVSFIKK